MVPDLGAGVGRGGVLFVQVDGEREREFVAEKVGKLTSLPAESVQLCEGHRQRWRMEGVSQGQG